MGMEMGMGMDQYQRPELRLEQKQALRQLLEISQHLRHESFETAVRGFEGMEAADKILKAKGLRGLLIGGLSEEVWNPKHNKKNFATHKDVDVLIPEIPEGVEIGDLEGGIDWWLPKDAKLKIKYEGGVSEVTGRFWENAFKMRLAFGVRAPFAHELESGLYIPSVEFVRAMRKAEAMTQLDRRVVVEDGDVTDALDYNLEKKIKDEMAPSVRNRFSYGEVSKFVVNHLDHEAYVAINGSEESDLVDNFTYYIYDTPPERFIQSKSSEYLSRRGRDTHCPFDIYNEKTHELVLEKDSVLDESNLKKLIEGVRYLNWPASLQDRDILTFLKDTKDEFEAGGVLG